MPVKSTRPRRATRSCAAPTSSEARLDLERWANDAMVLGLPCSRYAGPTAPASAPVCGESLNDADPEAHRHGGGGDPRMSKLRDLKLESCSLPCPLLMAVPKKKTGS